jgi:phthalate 4,5-cis-dihydrodiol dehydrogenase
MSANSDPRVTQPLRLAVAGLGLAGAFMIRAAVPHPRIVLVAAMDTLARPRETFAHQYGARTYADFHSLCQDDAVEAIYIASPHRFHAEQAIEAMEHGKHVLLEKPMALTLPDCDAIVAAADRTGMTLIVGHTHAFDSNVREMSRIIRSGELGRLGMILSLNYNDFLVRPHRADEFDPNSGGGIAFNQVTHQIEVVRLLGGRVRSVCAGLGALEPTRSTPGHCAALLRLENSVVASVIFSGYGFFDSDEWHHWIGEGGGAKDPEHHAKMRDAFSKRTNEKEAHEKLGFGGRVLPTEQPYLPHFGVLVATCERGDLRYSPHGISSHGLTGAREIKVPLDMGRPGQGDALDALWSAVRDAKPCVHDARWGRDTVKIILAILESSKTHREIAVI